ncbi:MAG: hypothetical protein JKY34_07315 [Kordiimonadaceae bacterium]|nr:hypothetical protein [Kordiimonadaceae bacterium]
MTKKKPQSKTVDRTQFLKALSQSFATLEVPALGGKIRYRPMSLKELNSMSENQSLAAAMIINCVVDSNDQHLFTDDDASIIEAIPHTLIGELISNLMKINGFDQKQIEEAEKTCQRPGRTL